MTVTKITVETRTRSISLLLITCQQPTTDDLTDRIKGVLGLGEEVIEVSAKEIDVETVFILGNE